MYLLLYVYCYLYLMGHHFLVPVIACTSQSSHHLQFELSFE